ALLLDPPEDVPRVYTDDKKLSQILRNYISNALKFTTHGQVTVSARRQGTDGVTFTVSDTGIGIATEFQNAIFQDFVQIDSPLQKKWRGTGLGLSLCKKIAVLLGGSVGMSSEPGVGSVFWVTIPIHFQRADSEPGSGAPSAHVEGNDHGR